MASNETINMHSKKKKTYFTPNEIKATKNFEVQDLSRDFIEKIDYIDYPCVGAKSAINTNQFRFGIYGLMGTEETTEALGSDLKKYIEETISANSNYMSMIAIFKDKIESEFDFENKLWSQLQELYNSEKNEQAWDKSVGSNPEENDFSFSFGGTAFFIVGLHPHSSRRSRRFKHSALAFNLHRQFEQLRDKDLYEKMKQTIRNREIEYDGSINPMLKDHGKGLEAPQYSGRKVGKNWKCPFQL